MHGRELARDARVARGGHRGEQGAKNGFGFGFVGTVFFSARFTASCLACRSACKSCMSSMRAAFGRAALTLNENASSAVNRSKITASGSA